MTVTDLPYTRTRRRTRPETEPTAESAELARIEADIRAVREALADPHGWEDRLTAELDRLEAARAELVALTATTTLAA